MVDLGCHCNCLRRSALFPSFAFLEKKSIRDFLGDSHLARRFLDHWYVVPCVRHGLLSSHVFLFCCLGIRQIGEGCPNLVVWIP